MDHVNHTSTCPRGEYHLDTPTCSHDQLLSMASLCQLLDGVLCEGFCRRPVLTYPLLCKVFWGVQNLVAILWVMSSSIWGLDFFILFFRFVMVMLENTNLTMDCSSEKWARNLNSNEKPTKVNDDKISFWCRLKSKLWLDICNHKMISNSRNQQNVNEWYKKKLKYWMWYEKIIKIWYKNMNI